jgi:serine protease inhibitor
MKFNKTLTNKSTFYGLESIREEHLMMLKHKRFRFIEESGNKYLVMQYTNQEYAFCAILPRLKEGIPINTSILDITSPHVEIALNAPYELVNVWIPRFKKEIELDLIPFLKKRGIKSIFNGTTNIENMSNSKELLSISLLKQKVKIIVEENGVEASAATIISGRKTGRRKNIIKPKIYNFLANHPFTYYIVHVPSHMILFSGVYK